MNIKNNFTKSPYVKIVKDEGYVLRLFSIPQQYKFEKQCLLDCCHPCVQKIILYDDDFYLIKLKYYSGMNTLLTLEKCKIELFILLIPKIVEAITYCHSCGWVCGDLKPENILYNPITHQICLIDFSAALPINTVRQTLTYWQYTPYYSSYSQCNGINLAQPQDDWFAFRQCLLQVLWLTKDIELKYRLQTEINDINEKIEMFNNLSFYNK